MYSYHPGVTEVRFTDAMYYTVFASPAHASHKIGFIEWGCGDGTVLLRLSQLNPVSGARFFGIELDTDMANRAKDNTHHTFRITIFCQTFIIEDAKLEQQRMYYTWHQQMPVNRCLMHYFNNHNYHMSSDHVPELSFDSRLSLQVNSEFKMRANKRRKTRQLESDVFVSLGMVPNLTW